MVISDHLAVILVVYRLDHKKRPSNKIAWPFLWMVD